MEAAQQVYEIRTSRWGLGVSILKAFRGFQRAVQVKTLATKVPGAASPGSLLEIQSLRPLPGPSESESVFPQDPRVWKHHCTRG